jgi:hypothetical protein
VRPAECEIDRQVLLSSHLQPRGVDAFVAGARSVLGVDFEDFLKAQAATTLAADWSQVKATPEETLRHVDRTKLYRPGGIPAGMVAIPATQVCMATQYRNRECGFHQVPGQELATHPGRGLHRIVRFDRQVQFPRLQLT